MYASHRDKQCICSSFATYLSFSGAVVINCLKSGSKFLTSRVDSDVDIVFEFLGLPLCAGSGSDTVTSGAGVRGIFNFLLLKGKACLPS